LNKYQAKWREPIISNWREYQLVSSAPPSSGGIAVSQWLRMYDLVKQRTGSDFNHNSTQYIHTLSEVGKRVFADRAEYLGDPDFIEVPKTALLDENYLIERSSDIQLIWQCRIKHHYHQLRFWQWYGGRRRRIFTQ